MDSLDLSRRAVAAGWEFTPGQRVFAESLGMDDNTIIPDGYTGNAAEMAQLRPDFRDAATRGALLDQVRRRWGKQVYAVPICDAETITHWLAIVPDHELPEWGWPAFDGADEVSTLIAALEAAPKG